jgi:Lon-like protease
MRRLFYIASALIIAWAAVVVPLPLAVFAPTPPTNTIDTFETVGEVGAINGELLITTVGVLPSVSTYTAVTAWFDQHREVTLRVVVVPPDVDEEELFEQQRQVFRESARIAAAVGLEHAGQDVTVTGDGVHVRRVMEDAPVGDALEEGDVIIGANGRKIGLVSELLAITGEAEVGDELELTVKRGEEEIEVSTVLGIIPGSDQVGLGVLVETLNQRIEYPEGIEIEVRETRIGGPSGGLMLALAVYDVFSEEDLVAGRIIAGTGTVGPDGRVGGVGGVDKKVRGAEQAGATVFLVPAQLVDVAREAAPGGMEIIPVETFEDALTALRR